MRTKRFDGGLVILPDEVETLALNAGDDLKGDVAQLRFLLEEENRATRIQDNVDLLLTPQLIGGEKGFREKDGRLEFDAIISGDKVDRDGEVVNQQTLKEVWESQYVRNPVMMYQHAWGDVVGIATEFWQDSKSTSGPQQSYATFLLGKGIHYAHQGVKFHIDDIVERVKQTLLRSISIAFNSKRIIEEGSAPRLDLTDLFENSLVTIPSYRDAQIVHLMFESYRGNAKLPRGFNRLLYLGEELDETEAEKATPMPAKQVEENPETWSEETDAELQAIAARLDVDWTAQSIPAPTRAEAEGKSLEAALRRIEILGRV